VISTFFLLFVRGLISDQIIITMSEKKTKKSWFYTGEEDVPWEQWSVSILSSPESGYNSSHRIINAELRQPKSTLGTDPSFITEMLKKSSNFVS
jgi:hypothetical protein